METYKIRQKEYPIDEVKCVVHKEVPISHVFRDNEPDIDLFYMGCLEEEAVETTFAKSDGNIQ